MQKNYDSTIRHLIFWFLFFVIGFIALATVTDMYSNFNPRNGHEIIIFILWNILIFYFGYVARKCKEKKHHNRAN